MKKFRFLIFLLTLWLIILFNLKPLLNLFADNTFSYISVLVIAVIIILVPGTHRIPGWVVVMTPTLIFLFSHILWGDFKPFAKITLILSESISIFVTILLAYWVNVSFRKYEKKAMENITNKQEKIYSEETNGLGYIYREVRRARNHNNPMALLAIAIDEISQEFNHHSNNKATKAEIKKDKNLIQIGNILCNELEDCAVIVQEDDHFLVALPETKPEEIPFISERLRRQSKTQIGVDLSVGTASLPKDGYTFTGLFEKATSEMRTDIASKFLSESKKKRSEQTVFPGK